MPAVNITIHTLSGSSHNVQITPDTDVVELWEQLPKPEFHTLKLFHGVTELLSGTCAEVGLGEGTMLTMTMSEVPEEAMAAIRQAVASVSHMGIAPKILMRTEKALDFLLEFAGRQALDENFCDYLLGHLDRFQFASQNLLSRCAKLLGRTLPPSEFEDRLVQLWRDNPRKLHWTVALGEMTHKGKQHPKINHQFLSEVLSAIDLQFWLRRFPELACETCLGLSRLASWAFRGDDHRGDRTKLLERFETFELKVEALNFELKEKAAVDEALKMLRALEPEPRTDDPPLCRRPGDGWDERRESGAYASQSGAPDKAARNNMEARSGSSSSFRNEDI